MPKISDSVRSTHGQDGAIVLDVQQGQMFHLNLVGSRILELLKSGVSESEIVDVVSREFDISRDLANNDIRAFIETLKKHHLVKDCQSGATV
jgi:hypothetical protein